MVNSAGKMLREARLRKDLRFEEAARATKIRTDRLADLENDDYTRFANMAYAKGFLLIYAKYLGVDVSEFSKAMGIGNPVGMADYDYLNNAHATYEPATRRDRPAKRLNYKMAVTVLVTAFSMYWVMQFAYNLKRIGPAEKLIERKNNPEEIAAPQASPPSPQPPETVPSVPAIAAIPAPVPEPTIEIRRAEPVTEPLAQPESTQPASLKPSPTSNDAQTQHPSKSRAH